MSLSIKRISIRNFRSIRNLSLSPAKLAVLVGKNDSGKSNVLRALNLFFNSKINDTDDLDFEVDHNVFNLPNRRAKEISVKIEFEIPENYKATNGDKVVWEKRWRSGGLIYDEYEGQRKVSGPRGGISWETVSIPQRSNLHALLRNIKFVYVPAIKDMKYFSMLRASIYKVISEVANREFRNSSQEFESSISNQLEDLTSQISESLGFQSRLALPRDLSHIFESLDFLSDQQNISLDSRGDGVKARHIPLILKFIADKKCSLQGRGAQPFNFIWGYEEPENSLEFSSSVELADQFWDFINDGISQVFLTTHSPIFYNLKRKEQESNSQISCHHTYYDAEEDGTKVSTDMDDLDERMGTTALFAPMIEDLEDKIRRQEKARNEVRELAEENRRKIFVEGPSDQVLIRKALLAFSPERATEIDVVTHQSAGVNYVIDMLASWRRRAKHHQEMPRSVGLVDADKDGRVAAREWNRVSNNVISAKCFKLPTPDHIIPALQAGFKVPIVLETLYDLEAWKWAEQNGHLEQRSILSVIPADLNEQIVGGNTTLDEHLEPEWAMYVRYKFLQEGKGPMARHFSNMPDEEFRARFFCLEQIVIDIINYLYPD